MAVGELPPAQRWRWSSVESNKARFSHVLGSPHRMAAQTQLMTTARDVLFRASASDFDALRELLFRRYPDYEWATFAQFGWRSTSDHLILTLARLDPPAPGELDDTVGHVMIHEPYTLRIALQA